MYQTECYTCNNVLSQVLSPGIGKFYRGGGAHKERTIAMKNITTRLVSAALAVSMMLSVCPISAFAAEDGPAGAGASTQAESNDGSTAESAIQIGLDANGIPTGSSSYWKYENNTLTLLDIVGDEVSSRYFALPEDIPLNKNITLQVGETDSRKRYYLVTGKIAGKISLNANITLGYGENCVTVNEIENENNNYSVSMEYCVVGTDLHSQSGVVYVPENVTINGVITSGKAYVFRSGVRVELTYTGRGTPEWKFSSMGSTFQPEEVNAEFSSDKKSCTLTAQYPLPLSVEFSNEDELGPEPEPEPDEEISSGSSGADAGGAIAAAVIAAGAGWAGYELGVHLYQKHSMGLDYWPENRLNLAKAVWEKAGKPAPESTALYADIDADDADAQQAARWCVEQGLLTVKENAADAFKPEKAVTRLRCCLTWQNAKNKGLFDGQPTTE